MKKATLVFTGFNPRAVIAYIRTLEADNVPYGLIAKSSEDTTYQTSYKDKVLAERESITLDLNDLIDKVRIAQEKLQADEYVIAPSTEALNRFLLDNRSAFQELNCKIPLVDSELYKQISDKHTFGEMCKERGLLVPEEYADIMNASPPFVAKPKTYYSKSGNVHTPILIFDEAEKSYFLKTYNQDDFYYQKFITGECLYLLYYFYKDGSVAKFSEINLIQQPQGKSIVAAKSTDFHNSTTSVKYEELFQAVGFRGLVMVEVKNQGGKYYMIEANPRFWGPSQLFVDAGVNLFECLLYDYKLIDSLPEINYPKKTVRYFWYGGIVDAEKANEQLTYHAYSPEEYKKDWNSWLSADIYNRTDTIGIYNQEIGNS